jgi:formylglycine-generating enzyme required for sulfatase activity
MKRTFGLLLAGLTVLLTTSRLTGQEASPETVQLRFVGANPAARLMPLTDLPAPSYFFLRGRPDITPETISKLARSWYRNVYPGIDLICYDNGYDMEYVFVVAPGADPDLIRMAFAGVQNFSITETGSIVMRIKGGEIIQSPPVAYVKESDSKRPTDALYEIGHGGIISVRLPRYRAKQAGLLNGSSFNLIPRGGQPGGPMYNYYLSKFEITNEQYLRFLNSAEANSKDALGSFMFFDKRGNVWIHPDRKPQRDELFTLMNSVLAYDSGKPVGARYDHRRAGDKSAPFASHPVAGVSWYGAIKYCNWLTITSGRTAAECCYKEGTNAVEWAPTAATNWSKGLFSDSERELWLAAKGFRLPMVNDDAPIIATNSFNEFYKAAAWNVFTNRLYGFGRDSFDGTDANCRETIGLKKPTSLPVGSFNGEVFLGKIRTHPNGNLFGVFDLTGNANEWMNDFGTKGDPSTRLICGGSWNSSLHPLTSVGTAPPYATDTVSGFRPTTTYMPSESLIIHILFSFFMEPGGVSTTEVSAAAAGLRELAPEEEEAAMGAEGGGTGAGESLEAEPYKQSLDGISYKEQELLPVTPLPEEEGGEEEGGGPEIPFIPIPPTTNTLVVESLSPNAGVSIAITTDINGDGNGTTPTIIRRYIQGTLVTLTAPTVVGPDGFVRWLRNGVPYSTTPSITFTMSGDVTMTAVYAPIVRTLRVRSSNPNTGVPITVTPNDNNGNGNGTTSFDRLYPDAVVVNLTAPLTAGGNRFQKWQRNGVDYSLSLSTSVTMDNDYTMMAIYVYVPDPIPDPDASTTGGI